jgi:Lrp/AsnC family transcriptional regulator, leucine-responsive regulatory protein
MIKQSITGLDEKDIAIVKLLQHNAKMTIAEIAKTVNLSNTPVHERIKRLEQEGIIKQYGAIVDHNKVDKGLIAICYVSLKEHSKTAGSKFVKNILQMPEVVECFTISGEFDFMLKVLSKDMNAYHDFHINRLSNIENIGQVQTVFVMGVVKDTHCVV